MREFYNQRIKRGLVRRLNNGKLARVAKRVARQSPTPSGAPVIFFKASTGIDDLSWNSGFHLLSSWALRLKGIPVAYFACHSGMSHCVLGTNRDDVRKPPPCKSCIYQSRTLYTGVEIMESDALPPGIQKQAPGLHSKVYWFDFQTRCTAHCCHREPFSKGPDEFRMAGTSTGPDYVFRDCAGFCASIT